MPTPKKLKVFLLVGILGFLFVFVILPLLGHTWRNRHPPILPSVVPVKQWKFFDSVEGRFRILFPGSPEETNVTLNTTTANIIMPCFFVWADRQTEYAVNYNDYPKALEKLSPQRQFDLAQNGVVSEIGNIVTQRDFVFRNYPARDFEFIAGGKANYAGKMRLVLDGERLYQIVTIFLTNNPHEDDFKTFFDSFAITKEQKN